MSQENAELDIEMPDMPEQNPPSDEVETENQELEVEPESEEEPPEMEIKEIIPDAEVFRDAPPQKKPTRKATEQQKAHLAKIRVKALEAKKKKREAKMGIKTPKVETPKSAEQEQAPEPAPTQNPKPLDKNEVPESLIHLTPQQLRQLQIEAIGGYDQMRKNRKKKKQEEQAKQAQEQETLRVIQKAVKPHDDDGWGVCFQ